MEKIIPIPEDIEVSIEGNIIRLKYQGKLSERKFNDRIIEVGKKDNSVIIKAKKKRKDILAVVNTTASHIRNMVIGLTQGYEYKLEVVYSHFPISVSVKEGFVEISNLAGQKNPIKSKIVRQTTVEAKGKDIIVKSIDKGDAGQTAANLESATKLRGRDRRVFQDGIYIVSKPKSVPLEDSEEAEKDEGREEGKN